jgi:uncharacterized membrane protein YhdT
MNFYDLMGSLARMGVWDVILPFMLIFTIVYATLTATLYTDKKQQKFAVIIALVIGFGVVIPHSIGAYPPGADVVDIINTALPNVALIAVGIIGLLILLGMFGITLNLNGAPFLTIIVGLAALAIIYVFGSAGGVRWRIPRWLSFLNDSDTQALLIVVVVFYILVKLITKDPDAKDNDGNPKKKGVDAFIDTMEKLSKGFGK